MNRPCGSWFTMICYFQCAQREENQNPSMTSEEHVEDMWGLSQNWDPKTICFIGLSLYPSLAATGVSILSRRPKGYPWVSRTHLCMWNHVVGDGRWFQLGYFCIFLLDPIKMFLYLISCIATVAQIPSRLEIAVQTSWLLYAVQQQCHNV